MSIVQATRFVAGSILFAANVTFVIGQDDHKLTRTEIDVLIQQLSDSSFETRQKASTALIKAGAEAKQQLTEALDSDDPEVQSRCKLILTRIHDAEAVQRRKAFLAGKLDQPDTNKKSWKAFEKIAGNSAESRKLFVDMQDSYADLLQLIEQDDPQCSNMVDRLCLERYKSKAVETKADSRKFAALVAFTGSQIEMDSVSVCRGTGRLMHYGRTYGHDDELIRDLLASWVERGPTSRLKMRILFVASEYKLEEAPKLARLMLAEPEVLPQHSLKVLAEQGVAADIDLIEPLIWNKSTQSLRRVVNSKVHRSVADYALAVCLKLSGQKLKDYGFVSPSGEVIFDGPYGFETEEQRDAAREHWKEFRKQSKQSEN